MVGIPKFIPRLWKGLPSLAKAAVAIVSGLTVLVAGFQTVRSVYSRTIGADRAALGKLAQLSVSVQIDEFDRILGRARFKNAGPDFTEVIYVDPRYYVQAVTLPTGKVVFYSVTSRREDFMPPFVQFHRFHTCGSGQDKICDEPPPRLNLSHFIDLTPVGISSYSTAAHFGYAEAYGGSHADDFLTFLLIYNDVGCTSIPGDPAFDAEESLVGPARSTGVLAQQTGPSDIYGIDEGLLKSLTNIRSVLRPNAFAVATEAFDLKRFSDPGRLGVVGPDPEFLMYGPKAEDLGQISDSARIRGVTVRCR